MTFELLGAVKQITVCGQYAAAVGRKIFCYIDHFGIELADPLHFIIFVEVMILDKLCSFHDHIAVHTLALPLRDKPKCQSDKLVAFFGSFQPKELEFMIKAELSI